MAKKKTRKTSGKVPMAVKADRHVLYQKSVQAVDAEIDFVDETYKTLRGRHAITLREDFCGTANTSCEWVRRRRTNHAWGVDLDADTLAWGIKHNIAKLKPQARERITLVRDNVLHAEVPPVDIVLAMNFSYFLLTERKTMLEYFRHVHQTLAPGGLFMLDAYGGYESFKESKDKRKINNQFTYVWDQASYDPITGLAVCHIHFYFADGSKMNKAFSYQWRMWSLPEIKDLLVEAGFVSSTVYWEGTDENDEGDGNFDPAETAENDPAWICYIVAEK